MATIDEAISQWTRRHGLDETLRQLAEARIPAGRPYTVADIVGDQHYRARGMLRSIDLPDGSTLQVPGVVPKLSATPGDFAGGGPALGADTDAVLRALGLPDDELRRLRERGVIA
jgi:formyl-CoA transferase